MTAEFNFTNPDEVKDLDPEFRRELKGHIGEAVFVALPATLIGVGTKGITIQVTQMFGEKVAVTVSDFNIQLANPPASEAS